MKYSVELSDNDAEVTPVPIPNTEVKLRSADDTRTAASRESRKLLRFKKPHTEMYEVFLYSKLYSNMHSNIYSYLHDYICRVGDLFTNNRFLILYITI